MTVESDMEALIDRIEDELNRGECDYWWYGAALSAVENGWYRAVPQRGNDALYLARFWLTQPRSNDDGEFESANCCMLHYFAAGDDDGALHDHPWSFRTTILSGGYTELLPAEHAYGHLGLPGPELWEHSEERRAGDVIHHEAHDLHAAVDPLADTWTLVTTMDRHREWGFHPPGKPWVQWQQYLNQASA